MKKVLCLLLVATMLFGLIGCSTGKEATSETERTTDTTDSKIKIGFSIGQSLHPQFAAELLGAQTAAKELGVELIYTTADYDMQTQLADIENLVQKGVDAVIYSPIDSEALAPITEELKSKGIGTFTVDIGVIGAEVDSHIASDNYEIGVIAADYLASLINEEGPIAIVGWSTVTACIDREAGFMDTLKEKYPNIKVVAQQDGEADRSLALEKTENIIQAHPEIVAIFGSNEMCALGAMGALDSANLDIPVVGVDATIDILNAVKNDTKVKATVSQDPYMMGYESVVTAVKKIKGEPFEKEIATPVELVTKENVQPYIDKQEEYIRASKEMMGK